MKIKCPHCYRSCEVKPQNLGQSVTCPNCQQKFVAQSPNLQECPDCGNWVSRRAPYCPHCGAPIAAQLDAPQFAENSPAAAPDSPAPEQEILFLNPSVLNYCGLLLIGIVLTVAGVGIFILLYLWIKIHCTSYRITNQRIVVREGWLAKHQTEIRIKDMRSANLNQTVWQRIIGIGDVSIGTAATEGTEIYIQGIADPQSVVDQINALRE